MLDDAFSRNELTQEEETLKKDIVKERLPPSFSLLRRMINFVASVTIVIATALLAWNIHEMGVLDREFEFIYEVSHAEKLYAALRIELRQYINYANYGDAL